MDVAIRHSPSFAAARITLDANEQIRAESGAMMATSYGLGVTSSTQGGMMKGLKRSFLGGESLFVTTFTAPVAGGVIQAPKSGEGFVFDFTGPGWVMTQTRNPSALEAWIRQIMPGETGGASGAAGVLGGLLGR